MCVCVRFWAFFLRSAISFCVSVFVTVSSSNFYKEVKLHPVLLILTSLKRHYSTVSYYVSKKTDSYVHYEVLLRSKLVVFYLPKNGFI